MGKRNKLVKEMTDEEIENEIPIYTNIEFKINDFHYILKNINITDFNDYDNIKLIKLFMVKVDWYQVMIYDKICILDSYFLLIERTRSRIVLVKESSGEHYFSLNS